MSYSFCSRTSDFKFFFVLRVLSVYYCDTCKSIKMQAEVSCIYHVNVKHKNVLVYKKKTALKEIGLELLVTKYCRHKLLDVAALPTKCSKTAGKLVVPVTCKI